MPRLHGRRPRLRHGRGVAGRCRHRAGRAPQARRAARLHRRPHRPRQPARLRGPARRGADAAPARWAPPVGVVVVDVNGLKRINDRHGHVAGDRALTAFGSELSTAASALPDTPGRAARRRRVLPARRRRLRRPGGRARAGRLRPRRRRPRRGRRVRRRDDRRPARRRRSPRRGCCARPTPRSTAPSAPARGCPVVAGRTARGRPARTRTLEAPERRQFRGRGSADPGQALDEVLRRLDAAEDHDPCGRLVAVAEVLRETVDAAELVRLDAAGRLVDAARPWRTTSSGSYEGEAVLRPRQLRDRRVPGDLRRAHRAVHRRRRRRPAQRPGRGLAAHARRACRRWS